MTEQKKNKPVKKFTAKKTWPVNDPVPAGTHSQDADRHRKAKHPVSDK